MGKYHDVELDSCLWAWIISPSVDNSQRCEKTQLGVIWTVAVWCPYLFEKIRFGFQISPSVDNNHDLNCCDIETLRYEGSRDTPHADKFLTGFYYGFIFCIFWLSSWQRIDRGCEPLRFQSHLVLIIINYQLGFSHEEVSTALVPISRKKK